MTDKDYWDREQFYDAVGRELRSRKLGFDTNALFDLVIARWPTEKTASAVADELVATLPETASPCWRGTVTCIFASPARATRRSRCAPSRRCRPTKGSPPNRARKEVCTRHAVQPSKIRDVPNAQAAVQKARHGRFSTIEAERTSRIGAPTTSRSRRASRKALLLLP